MPISSGMGILPVQMSRHNKSHGQDARATGVEPIDPVAAPLTTRTEMLA